MYSVMLCDWQSKDDLFWHDFKPVSFWRTISKNNLINICFSLIGRSSSEFNECSDKLILVFNFLQFLYQRLHQLLDINYCRVNDKFTWRNMSGTQSLYRKQAKNPRRMFLDLPWNGLLECTAMSYVYIKLLGTRLIQVGKVVLQNTYS